MIHYIFGAVFQGWSLGSNDAANVFGTAVASRIIPYSRAVILASIFVILGAVLQGSGGMNTVDAVTAQSLHSAFLICLVAALTVSLMTFLRLPVSTSQATMGAIAGYSLGAGRSIDAAPLLKVAVCWVGTPTGAAIAALMLYPMIELALRSLRLSMIGRSRFITIGLTLAGCYGAYALGANNVANVTGVYYAAGMFDSFSMPARAASALGGAAIALGSITFSKRVMTTVGSRLVHLDGLSALVAVLAADVTVHFYAIAGVPVSTSQAVVGSVLGIGISKGIRTINMKTVRRILFGWLFTPMVPAAACIVLALITEKK